MPIGGTNVPAKVITTWFMVITASPKRKPHTTAICATYPMTQRTQIERNERKMRTGIENPYLYVRKMTRHYPIQVLVVKIDNCTTGNFLLLTLPMYASMV